MSEVLTLTAAEIFPSITTYQAVELNLDLEHGIIQARLKNNLGESIWYWEQDADTTGAILALNKANLSIKSLNTRLLERISAKGFKVGTVSGSPE